MSIADTRFDQLFPVLDALQLATTKRFASGLARSFSAGELVYDVGVRNSPAWLVLDGELEIIRSDGLHRQSSVVSLGAGQFSGEVSQLAGRGTLAAAHAGPRGCTALPFDAAHIRALVVGSAEVGEIVMRAFILRRVALLEEGGVGSLLIGRPGTPNLLRLEGFLSRNAYPYTVLDAATDEAGQAAVERFGVHDDDLPLMICPNGAVLKRPSDAEAAMCLGITPELDPKMIYDVAVVGAGPAGLAAAVYGASEGLSMIVLDQRAFGGQAGASARIENYLGFPTGISGQAWRAAPSRRRRNSVRKSPFRWKWRSWIALVPSAANPSVSKLPAAARCRRGPSSSPPARVTGGLRSAIFPTSTITAFRIGPRRSKPSCARARRSP